MTDTYREVRMDDGRVVVEHSATSWSSTTTVTATEDHTRIQVGQLVLEVGGSWGDPRYHAKLTYKPRNRPESVLFDGDYTEGQGL